MANWNPFRRNATPTAAAAIATPTAPPIEGPYGTGVATAAAATADANQVRPWEERGVVGTPIVSGFVNELGEYNPKLYGMAANKIYEEMRRGDSQVAATLAVLKLPIRSGNGTIEPAGDKPLDKEIAKFVEESLFSGLEYVGSAGQLVSQSWDDVQKNALLMLDFGAAAHEEVWMLDGDTIRLKKLAPRLPLTFYRFLTEADGETLIELQQYGYRGNVFMVTGVPAWKLGLFVNDMEGANFYGRSVLRAAYKHWYLKEVLLKVDTIACERNGLGVPTISHIDSSARPLSAEDKETAYNFVTKLASHESTGVYVPPGLKFDLVGVKGQVRNCHDSIRLHNEQISKTTLAMFMDQGQAAQGNRALGASMQDFFFIGCQAVADQVARTITHSTIRRLVDFNYDGINSISGAKSTSSGPGAKASGYPRLKAPQVKYVNLSEAVEALSKLATFQADMVHPDDDAEEWLRQKLGMPKIGKPRTRFTPTAIRVQDNTAAPGAAPPSGELQPEQLQADAVTDAGAGGKQPPAGNATPAAAAARAPKKKAVPMSEVQTMCQGVRVARAPKGVEQHLALSEIVGALDTGAGDVASLLRKAKPAAIAEALHKATAQPAGHEHEAVITAPSSLTPAIVAKLEAVKDNGRRQVYAERNRQLAGAAPRNPIDGKLVGAETPAAADLGLFAKTTVSDFLNKVQQRATSVALAAKKNPGGATTGQSLLDSQQLLEDAKDGWIDRLASEAVNEAFSAGRGAGFDELADEIDRFLYSALLDIHTCDPCQEADGTEGQLDEIPDTPNPDCEGGDQCRCVIVAIFSDEVKGK